RSAGRRRVPRADLVADVAAEDPGADHLPRFRRERSAVLDGPVADAAVAVQAVRLREGAGGTGFEAAGAGPAEVREGDVRRQVEREEKLAEEEPGAGFRMQQVGVLPGHSETRPRRQLALQDGSGVDVPPAGGTGEGREDSGLQGGEPLAHHVVVV